MHCKAKLNLLLYGNMATSTTRKPTQSFMKRMQRFQNQIDGRRCDKNGVKCVEILMQHVCRLRHKAEISGCKCYLFLCSFIYLFSVA